MKHLLCLSLIMGVACTTTVQAQTPLQLTIQKTSAQPAHLTTRIQWVKFPQPSYDNADLQDQNRAAIIRVYADENGNVNKATVQESTGLATLDQRLIDAILVAKVKPHVVNGNVLPIIGYQAFNLKLKEDNQELCQYQFNSKNWIAQQNQQKTTFTYLQQPELSVNQDQLNGHNRAIKFTFKVDKHGNVKKVKIKQGSGIYQLDQLVAQSVSTAQVNVPRQYWIYKKSNLKDEISFSLENCQ